jgi:nitronate monooxygenase
MAIANVLTDRLGIEHPIIQAPMAGGADTPELVAAVSEAGGLGSIGAAYLTPSQIRESAAKVRALTDRPFAINLFAPIEAPKEVDTRAAVSRVEPFYRELGLPKAEALKAFEFSFDDQLAAALETGAAVFSFTFGIPPDSAIEAAKSCGMVVMGTATNANEAIELERRGVDAVVAQSAEAGGHRGTFAGDFESGLVGAIALIPLVVDSITVPVVASGGIMDGRGIAAALVLGASAVQLGTAFLTAEEAGIPNAYKEAILRSRETDTRITRAFSGRPARGIRNRFMEAFDGEKEEGAILPFPLQNALTRPMRAAAGKQGRPEFLSLWAGQGLALARRLPAAEIIAALARELRAAQATLA